MKWLAEIDFAARTGNRRRRAGHWAETPDARREFLAEKTACAGDGKAVDFCRTRNGCRYFISPMQPTTFRVLEMHRRKIDTILPILSRYSDSLLSVRSGANKRAALERKKTRGNHRVATRPDLPRFKISNAPSPHSARNMRHTRSCSTPQTPAN